MGHSECYRTFGCCEGDLINLHQSGDKRVQTNRVAACTGKHVLHPRAHLLEPSTWVTVVFLQAMLLQAVIAQKIAYIRFIRLAGHGRDLEYMSLKPFIEVDPLYLHSLRHTLTTGPRSDAFQAFVIETGLLEHGSQESPATN